MRYFNEYSTCKYSRRFAPYALSVDREQMDRYYLYMEERNRERVKEWLESIGL